MKKVDLSKITNEVITQLENGTNAWIKPWKKFKGVPDAEALANFAYNYISNQPYSWSNQYGLKPGYYMTMKQCNDLGGKIKKGAKASWVLYSDIVKKELTDQEQITHVRQAIIDKLTKEGEDPNIKENNKYTIYGMGTFFTVAGKWFCFIQVNKPYTVFHINECEGYREIKHKQPKNITKPSDINQEEIDNIISKYCERSGVKFHEQPQNEAYYSPSRDEVHVPKRAQYENIEEFYSTNFHELGHSTGHYSRLNRFTEGNFFGSEPYSKEELVAEMTACFSLGYLEINTEKTTKNSAAYLKGWAEHLRSDKSLRDYILIASNQARLAFELIMGLDKNDRPEKIKKEEI